MFVDNVGRPALRLRDPSDAFRMVPRSTLDRHRVIVCIHPDHHCQQVAAYQFDERVTCSCDSAAMCCGPPLPAAGMPLSPATNRVLNSPVPSLTPRKRGIAIFPSSASKPKLTLNSSNPFVDNASSQGVPLALAAGKRKTPDNAKNEPILVGFTSSSQAAPPAPAADEEEENGDDDILEMPPRKSARRVIDLADQLEGEPNEGCSSQREDRARDSSSTSPLLNGRKPSDDEILSQLILETDADRWYDTHMYYREWEERLEVVHDIEKVNSQVKGLAEKYRIVDRLGEGTFSSVYQAIDVFHHQHNNDYWKGKDRSSPSNTGDDRPPLVYVALKRIYVTSSPERIHNELDIMEDLRGARNVAQLISAFRDEDQVIAVMPYHPNDDFRLFYRLLDPPSMQKYFRCLLRGLGDCHRRGIIHRDVKPANFLYDYARAEGVLVDFGLAEVSSRRCGGGVRDSDTRPAAIRGSFAHWLPTYRRVLPQASWQSHQHGGDRQGRARCPRCPPTRSFRTRRFPKPGQPADGKGEPSGDARFSGA